MGSENQYPYMTIIIRIIIIRMIIRIIIVPSVYLGDERMNRLSTHCLNLQFLPISPGKLQEILCNVYNYSIIFKLNFSRFWFLLTFLEKMPAAFVLNFYLFNILTKTKFRQFPYNKCSCPGMFETNTCFVQQLLDNNNTRTYACNIIIITSEKCAVVS